MFDGLNNSPYPICYWGVLNAIQIPEEAFPKFDFQAGPLESLENFLSWDVFGGFTFLYGFC